MTSLLHRVRDRLHAKLSTLLPEPTPTHPTINSMGQYESGVAVETMQTVMAWLFASLMNAGYYGQSHLYWLQPQVESAQNRELQQCHRRGEPILGYRCGDRMPKPSSGYYWQRLERGTAIPLLMEAFGHATQQQTLAYLGIQSNEIAAIYELEL